MHELAICEGIARAVVEHAGGRRVTSVKLRVGALRQVVPDALTFCWEVVGRRRGLDGSVLEIEVVPGEVVCLGCGARNTLTGFVLRCAECGGPVSVVAGDDLLVESIEVVSEDPAPVPAEGGRAGSGAGRDAAGSEEG